MVNERIGKPIVSVTEAFDTWMTPAVDDTPYFQFDFKIALILVLMVVIMIMTMYL